MAMFLLLQKDKLCPLPTDDVFHNLVRHFGHCILHAGMFAPVDNRELVRSFMIG